MAILNARHGTRTRGTFNIGIKLEGQWKQVNDLVNSLDTDIAFAAALGQRSFAKLYHKELRKNIKSGGSKFRYPGLSQRYKSYKALHGGSGGMLIWSKAMYNAIQLKELGPGKVGVGIETGTKRPDYQGESSGGNRLTISEYANIIEHGSYPMPARPIFKDTFNDIGGKSKIRFMIERALRNRFKSKGVSTIKL